MKSSARRLVLTLASLIPLTAAGGVATAQAGVTGASAAATGCTPGALSQPFASWRDFAAYELAPGGDFESRSWTLTGSAHTVSGSDPFAATGSLGASALSVPAGSSATSPLTCINASYPTLRMFVRGTGVALVSVVFRGISIPVGAIRARDSWAPSQIMHTGGAILALLGGGSANVSLRITGLTGSPVVDDVFIDPWQRT